MLIEFLQKFDGINDILFGRFDGIVENLPVADWVKDALCDSVHLIPFLFLIFVFIEIFERNYSHKIKDLSKESKKFGPLIGSVLAGLPQCGFSVIATPLYINKVITRGTLIAIYISTSDEAIPILLANPSQFKVVFPLLLIKIALGIFTGYAVDILLPQKDNMPDAAEIKEEEDDIGCCSHHVSNHKKRELLFHPLKHTLNIFFMILIISLGLNFCFDAFGNDVLNKVLLNNSIFQPVIAAVIGLIPNCAASVILTELFVNNAISFASLIGGLLSGSGVGILVLFRTNKNNSENIFILFTLYIIGVITGIVLEFIL